MSVVLDASALIAFFKREPGADVVERSLRDAVVSAVNLSEVLDKSGLQQVDYARVTSLLRNWNVDIAPFDAEQAALAATIRQRLGRSDISFADRACLALAQHHALPAVTADRLWRSFDIGIEIQLIRGEVN